ncbi:MAG: NACHT domain-containing protein [Phormidesmis sp.]
MLNRSEILSELANLTKLGNNHGTVIQFIEQRGKYNINAGDLSGSNTIGDTLEALDTDLLVEIRDLLREHRGKISPEDNALNELLTGIKSEVEIRLSSALLANIFHQEIIIPICKTLQPYRVQPHWEADAITPIYAEASGTSFDSTLEEFDRANGKLLILGAAGAGKTTTMLLLARELIERIESSRKRTAIPILFSCANWDSARTTAADWLISEMGIVYGIRPDIAKQWLIDHRLVLLIDGLDELSNSTQEHFIESINTISTVTQSLVVCSRDQSYGLLGTKLKVNTAIYLHSLSGQQIHDYFQAVNIEDGIASFNDNPDTFSLLQSPLMVCLSALANKELLAGSIRPNETAEHFLCRSYITSMLKRPLKSRVYQKAKKPTPELTLRYLKWIATLIKKEQKTEVLIENIKLSALGSKKKRYQYYLLSTVISFIVSGIVFFPIASKEMSFIFGCSMSLQLCSRRNIPPVETIAFSLSLAKKSLMKGVLFGLGYGMASCLMSGWLTRSYQTGLGLGLISCIAGGTFHVMYDALKGPEIDLKKIPNQGIKKSSRNALMVGLVCALLGAPLGFLLGQISEIEGYDEKFWLLFSFLTGGLSGWLVGGGLACIQHLNVRAVLWINKDIPWNCASFLNYATERRFLERVGGRYRFVHKRIRDYCASSGATIS